jgi:hypothetical protein
MQSDPVNGELRMYGEIELTIEARKIYLNAYRFEEGATGYALSFPYVANCLKLGDILRATSISIKNLLQMAYIEEVLSLDLEDSDCLYRIRRGRRIVYVSIHPDILPPADRTDSSRILARLRHLPA